MAKVLTPQQLEEYLYRRSDAADFVRSSLPPAKSEAEFRIMVRAAEEFGPGAWSNPRTGSPEEPDEYMREFQKQRAALQERLRQVLGEARIAEQDGEQKARAEEEQRKQKEEGDQRERAELASMADEAGVPAGEFQRFFERLKESEAELRPKFAAFEKSLTGTPEENAEKMKTAARMELERLAGETIGAKAHAMVDKVMKKIGQETKPQAN